jgi:uncharacterized membrane protein
MAEKKPDKKPPEAKPPSNIGTEVMIFIIVAVLGLPLIAYLFAKLPGSGVVEGLTSLMAIVKTTATVISMIALVVIMYTFMRISEMSKEESEKLGLALNWESERNQKNVRWERVEQYMTSLNPSDWKIAILEADNILDEIVERMGYKGTTLGERMKNIEASDFPYLEEVWDAHKLRNTLAHKGTNLNISRSEAEQAINIYHRVFKELGYL